MIKSFALILLVGAPDGSTQWTLSDNLKEADCNAMLTDLPQDVLLTTWGTEYAMDGFLYLMDHPDAPWTITCVPRRNA